MDKYYYWLGCITHRVMNFSNNAEDYKKLEFLWDAYNRNALFADDIIKLFPTKNYYFELESDKNLTGGKNESITTT